MSCDRTAIVSCVLLACGGNMRAQDVRAAAQLEDPGESLAALEAIVQSDPRNVQAHVYLARLHFFQGHYKRSRTYAQAVLRLETDQPFARNILGLCAWDLAEFKLARQHWERAHRDALARAEARPGEDYGVLIGEIEGALVWLAREERRMSGVEGREANLGLFLWAIVAGWVGMLTGIGLWTRRIRDGNRRASSE